jgi:hypothetical protein
MAYCTTTSFYCSLSVSAVRFDHALQEHTQSHVVAVIIPFRHTGMSIDGDSILS